ncbi:hypothetical protein QPK87_11210 [Kamptonema cortianum]|nr:hypothetical protein [Oscillatoria laete-virens]MDK3157143.1 hypothetical protein [Kamptonema cortianum]MDL5051119.1 hypothetical protein [Oscillatoria amoena NRMC-F 0135]MDL5055026.1 hypothetical protein [Oscillatoria laete-virens NRMC-F 0139]
MTEENTKSPHPEFLHDPLGVYAPADRKYFCMANRMIVGPYSPVEIGIFLVDKSLSYDDLVLDEDTGQWHMIGLYFEFEKLKE